MGHSHYLTFSVMITIGYDGYDTNGYYKLSSPPVWKTPLSTLATRSVYLLSTIGGESTLRTGAESSVTSASLR